MKSFVLCLCVLVILPIYSNGRLPCPNGEHYNHETKKCSSCPNGEFYNHHLKKCISCQREEYFNRKTQTCYPCSKCPVNTIIGRQCREDEDTFCRAFIEFDKFHQSPVIQKPEENDKEPNEDQSTTNNIIPQTEDQIRLVTEGPWYTIAMSLLGVLCLVSVFLAVYVVCVCFVCKKKRQEKEIIYDPELCDDAEGPVYTYLQSLLPWRGRRNQSTDSISDDSGQGTVRRQILIMPNGYIQPLDSIEYDADNSGQTISTASTDYVYFKAPSSATV